MGIFEVGREGLPHLDQGKEIGSSNLWDAEKLEGDENKWVIHLWIFKPLLMLLIDLISHY